MCVILLLGLERNKTKLETKKKKKKKKRGKYSKRSNKIHKANLLGIE